MKIFTLLLCVLLTGPVLAEPPTIEKRKVMKIVAWKGYAFPVPLWSRWLTRDADGIWSVWKEEPKLDDMDRGWVNQRTGALAPIDLLNWRTVAWFRLQNPVPGDWREQKYWIGDPK